METIMDNSLNSILEEFQAKRINAGVVATTRKLRVNWSVELAQDLNAFHQFHTACVAAQVDTDSLDAPLMEKNHETKLNS